MWRALKPEELLRLPCYTSTSSLCGVSPYLPLIAPLAPFTVSPHLGLCASELSAHFFTLLILLLLLIFFLLQLVCCCFAPLTQPICPPENVIVFLNKSTSHSAANAFRAGHMISPKITLLYKVPPQPPFQTRPCTRQEWRPSPGFAGMQGGTQSYWKPPPSWKRLGWDESWSRRGCERGA